MAEVEDQPIVEILLQAQLAGKWRNVQRFRAGVDMQTVESFVAEVINSGEFEEVRVLTGHQLGEDDDSEEITYRQSFASGPLVPQPDAPSDGNEEAQFTIEGRIGEQWEVVAKLDDQVRAIRLAQKEEKSDTYQEVRILERSETSAGGVSVREIPIMIPTGMRPPQDEQDGLQAPKKQHIGRRRWMMAAAAAVLIAFVLTGAKLMIDGYGGVRWAEAARTDAAIPTPALTEHEQSNTQMARGPALPLLDAVPPELEGRWDISGHCRNGYVSFNGKTYFRTTKGVKPAEPRRVAGYSMNNNEVIVLYADGESDFVQLVDGGFILIAKGKKGRQLYFVPEEERQLMRRCGNSVPDMSKQRPDTASIQN